MSNNPVIKPHERLRAAMELKGYNQELMAKAIGLSSSAFNLKINGHREFSLFECNLIAEKLDKTLDEIFFKRSVPE